MSIDPSEIIFDWNRLGREGRLTPGSLQLYDETLRDGIQSPSITDPPIEAKVELLHLMDALGIHWADIGLPGAGPRAVEDVTRLAREIIDQKLSIRPSCAARTHVNDVRPIIEISEAVGTPIEVMAFIGASPVRQYAEGWELDKMLGLIATAIEMGAKAGLPTTFVTEDTIRSRPEVLARLFKCAIDHGAQRLCLCDTVGYGTPDGVKNLIGWTRRFLDELGVDIGLDWHGHNDRGLALNNALSAAEYGASRIHGTALGIGERVGNTPMDLLLINFKLLGELDPDLSRLRAYANLAATSMDMPVRRNYPVLGDDAFRTATGVHAAAVIKAKRKGDDWLADRVYSGVPASWVGSHQGIEVGPMSGVSNVVHWLQGHDIEPADALVHAIFERAKHSDKNLTDEQMLAIAKEHSAIS